MKRLMIERCKKCGNDGVLNSRSVCADCVFKESHDGMDRYEYARSVQKQKTKKPTGEKELFFEIWAERPHKCSNCGKSLGNIPNVRFFSHIKSKGAYPELRLDKENIELLCLDCHENHEFGDKNK